MNSADLHLKEQNFQNWSIRSYEYLLKSDLLVACPWHRNQVPHVGQTGGVLKTCRKTVVGLTWFYVNLGWVVMIYDGQSIPTLDFEFWFARLLLQWVYEQKSIMIDWLSIISTGARDWNGNWSLISSLKFSRVWATYTNWWLKDIDGFPKSDCHASSLHALLSYEEIRWTASFGCDRLIPCLGWPKCKWERIHRKERKRCKWSR